MPAKRFIEQFVLPPTPTQVATAWGRCEWIMTKLPTHNLEVLGGVLLLTRAHLVVSAHAGYLWWGVAFALAGVAQISACLWERLTLRAFIPWAVIVLTGFSAVADVLYWQWYVSSLLYQGWIGLRLAPNPLRRILHGDR